MILRSRFSRLALIGLAACLLVAGPVQAAPGDDPRGDAPGAPAATTVTLKLASPSIAGCGSTRVEIWVNDVVDMYAADVHVTFDPGQLQVVDADVNAPGVQIEPLYTFMVPGFVIKRKACNAADPNDPDCPVGGKVWYSATQLNPTPPASGSGPIAAFTLIGRAEGLATLDISYHQFSSPIGQAIPATAVDSAITVTPPAPVPVAIAKLDATTARLSWPSATGGYWLYRADLPYFTPVEPPFATTAALLFDDATALGDVDVQHYYVVKAACSTGLTSAESNRTGAFDFALVAGS